MAYFTNFKEANAKLILDPTDYSTGGTDMGLIGTAHIAGFSIDTETFSNPFHGTTLTDARIMGVNWLYNVTLIDYSQNWMKLITRGTNTTNSFQTFTNYNLGHLVGSGQTHNLLIRPFDDTGVVDVTKPMLWIPRAFVLGAYSPVWDRTVTHIETVQLTIAALLDDLYSQPAFYGDSALLPAMEEA